MSGDPVRTKEPCYHLTLVGQDWQLTSPRVSTPRAFSGLEDAFAFVSTDSRGSPAIVEIRADGAYMVKRIAPRR
ncbi:MAG: hypothetical protein J0H44_27030 [Alphaproteobacteria bacterium]|nr:hypothetical protein [Alphaproteobacteria bacterium]